MDLKKLFEPASIAIVGASRNKSKVGNNILTNLLEGGYKGKIYPVNEHAQKIGSLRAYKAVDDIPAKIDCAIIAIPAPYVVSVVRACGQKGIPFVIVIAAGFKEVGGDGVQREEDLIALSKKYGIHILGPNCLGILNAHWNMNATFASGQPRKGNVSLISQSGAMIVSLLDWSLEIGLGIGSLVSIGNETDISATDLVEYLANDKNTAVIGIYLEELTAVPRFMTAISKVSRKKPIVVLKAGRSAEGQRAVASHTGSLAVPSAIVSGMLKQIGAIEVTTIEDLFNLLRFFSHPQRNSSRKLMVVTNAGGPGIAAVDALAGTNLELATASVETKKKIGRILSKTGAFVNPVDLRGDADMNRFKTVIDCLLADDRFGNLLILVTPQTVTPIRTLAHYIGAVARKSKKHILVSFIGGKHVNPARTILTEEGVVHFQYPNDAIKALDLSKQIYEKRGLYRGPIALRQSQLHGKPHMMLHENVQSLLLRSKIPFLKTVTVRTERDIEKIKKFPVAAKILARSVVHKQSAGGVVLNIIGKAELKKLLRSWRKHFEHYGFEGIIVQPMVQPGREMIVGFKKDPQMGDVILLGLGGTMTEAFNDVVMRIAPLSRNTARQMLSDLRFKKYLAGYDTAFIERLIVRLSQIIHRHPEIHELDFNPVTVYTRGGIILDARIFSS